MFNILARSAGIGVPTLATSEIAASALRPVVTGVLDKSQKVLTQSPPVPLSSETLNKALPKHGFLYPTASVSLSGIH